MPGSGSKQEPITIIGEVRGFDPLPSVEVAVGAFERAGVPFALIGGIALDAWGIPRATKDLDFAVPIGGAEKAVEQIQLPGLEVRPLRIGGLGLRLDAPSIRIDLIDRRFHFGSLYLDALNEAKQSGRRAQIGAHQLPLVSMEYLLAMKMVSGDDKDDADAQRLLQLERLDYRVARRLVEQHLGAATANRLDKWARTAGRPEVPNKLYQNGDHGSEE